MEVVNLINKTEKLNSIINFLIEKNGGKEDGFWEPLINDLRNCELIIDYPSGYSRIQNRDLIMYTFKTDDEQTLEELKESKNDIIDICEELLEDNYEFVCDEDGRTEIFFKLDRKTNKLPTPPKHTFEYCEKEILNAINNANHSIFAAIAWFTNQKIMNALIEKAGDGVDIILLVDKGEKQKDEKTFNFVSSQNQLNFLIFPCENINGKYKNLMHHKFCIIDNEIVYHGTYNWTIKAEFNDEDLTKDTNKSTVKNFMDRFKELRKKYNSFSCLNLKNKTFW